MRRDDEDRAQPPASGLGPEEDYDVNRNTDDNSETSDSAQQKSPSHSANQFNINRKTPVDTATKFLLASRENGIETVHHFDGDFFTWDRGFYVRVSRPWMAKALYDFLGRCRDPKGRFKPTKRDVNEIEHSLLAKIRIFEKPAPFWIDGRPTPAPSSVLACGNGLLDLPRRILIPNTPLFFGLNAVDYNFNPDAIPRAWLGFLNDLWSD